MEIQHKIIAPLRGTLDSHIQLYSYGKIILKLNLQIIKNVFRTCSKIPYILESNPHKFLPIS